MRTLLVFAILVAAEARFSSLKTSPVLHIGTNGTKEGATSPLNFLANRVRTKQEPEDNSTNAEEGPSQATEDVFAMTTKQMEDTVMTLMLGKSDFGATPMGDSVQKIIRIIKNTMEPKVVAAHNADQRQLNKLAADIAKCGSEKRSSLQVAQTQFVKYEKESRLHKTCRNTEAGAYTSKESCIREQKSLMEVKKLKCKAFAAVSNQWGHVKNNAEIVKKGGSESVQSYVARLSTTFCGSHVHGNRGTRSRRGGWGGGLANGMLDKYLRAKDACEKATKQWSSKVRECKRKISEYSVKKGQCNQFQTFMDGASCQRAVLAKDACESYAGCYVNKKKSYAVVEGKVRFEVVDRKAEWRGLKRIGCLIDAFADGRVTNDEIGVCKNSTYSTARFNIDYPNIPRLQKCTVPNLYPATEFYKKKEFAPLPAVAKGKDSQECTGMEEISLTPASGSPRSCKCERVTMNGFYSAGPLVKCTKCIDARRSSQKNSCPVGTKLFSPATKADWKTFFDSTERLADPHFIVDVTRRGNGCGMSGSNCQKYPWKSTEPRYSSWKTSDGSPWYFRDTAANGLGAIKSPGAYRANCYMNVKGLEPSGEVLFNQNDCKYHSKSYYCQKDKRLSLTPAKGSPEGCRCTQVTLAGTYSAGALVKCENCLTVRKSTQKNSCPSGMKIFSPRTKEDWKTFIRSADSLAAPNWIIDITKSTNGCRNCRKYAMNSKNPRQATWRTSDGSPWWLRSKGYRQPSGDYTANCYMKVYKMDGAGADNIRFNDYRCKYRSSSYYCQPKMKKPPAPSPAPEEKPEVKPKPEPVAVAAPVENVKSGFLEYQYYYSQNGRCRGRQPVRADTVRKVSTVTYAQNVRDNQKWTGYSRGTQYQVKWQGILSINREGRYEFILGSDDGSRLWLDSRSLINNDGYHGFRERIGVKTLARGQHKIYVRYFQGGGDHKNELTYMGPDTRGKVQQIPSSAVKYEEPKGFKEEVFYTGQKNRVNDAIAGTPAQTRVVTQVAYGSTRNRWPGFRQADGFGVRWTGTLEVYRGGRYRFWIRSDDGSKLYLGDKLFVNNDGPHGMRSKYGDKFLDAKSKTDLRLEYFERNGGAGMVLKYMGADTRNRLRVMRGHVVRASF